ncbi:MULTISPECIES: restriction endonuclease subunit S [Agrobacterium]|uniref:restriction endonuclease subunit S n=1 Tax=Agrobacterium TaxID=357 RepID=UPI00041AA414|nr:MULTISPECIES: restriction endonuclease subunit S [Agrobacterium]
MSREVPEGWRAARLSDVADLSLGQSPNSSETNEHGIGLPFFQGNAEFGERYPSPRRWAVTGPRLAEEGDILISVRAPVGELNIAPSRCVIGRGLGAIRARKIDTSFLWHALHFSAPQLHSVSQGSTFDAINRGDLSKLTLPLPPFYEQHRIAEILSSVDEAIATTRAVIEQTRKVKQGVLERLLNKGIGHTRFRQTEIGEIPEGWCVRRLEEIADIDRGKFSVRPRNDPRYFGGDIPFVQTGDVVSSDGLLTKHSQTLNQLGRAVSKEFPSGTILITIAANIGDTAITTYPVCCPDSVVGIVPHHGIEADWLREYLVLQKVSLDRQATQNAQKNINLQHLRPMPVVVPPLEEQQNISRGIRAMNASMADTGVELARMISLKSSLMSDLLTGRKRVIDALPMAAE